MKDANAPYPDAYWFSFPGSCPLQPWILKTPACRAQTRSGLCEPGETPDGVACTFAYNILGFLPLDDLVGISRTLNNATNKPFANFSEFCRFGHVEFDATDEGDVVQSLPFWTNPQDVRYNNLRTQQVLTAYRRLASPDGTSSQIDPRLRAKMQPLPSIQELRDSNPPCYMTVPMCSQAKFGCRRETYAQICRVCVQEEAGCVVTPSTFEFPELGTMENEAVDASAATSLWMSWWWMTPWTLLCVYY
ncbi:TPA: hypothetical protein N0F65_011972 [Lagenidium giganteum]|nr:TPA: hypothetical protein N0F65_011972 [Lagenidium giganteum]